MARPPGTPLAVLLLVAANLLVPLAIGIFGKGFFPYKPLLPGLAQFEDHGFGPAAPAAPFDRVIFMVVDALRSDFVYAANSGFQYTQSLIRAGAAVPFTAHATSPTVTMPRIKAITTGSIPSFLDVVLNVDEGDQSSSLASQDTWLAQMKAKPGAKRALLYGDDTWLKLFPDTFDRADGTSSFFVSDFSEVDNNVTRHIARELRNDDWSVMVLHYLGLDHIGHKGGPRSPHMLPKQREMDAIVRTIYDALDAPDAPDAPDAQDAQPHLASTLLVVCGDHGMNDAGNHGASSAGETSPALVFVSPLLRALANSTQDAQDAQDAQNAQHAQNYRQAPLPERDDFQFYRTVEQSDLAPTLGALLGFPAPQNNLGAFIPDFLPLWPNKRDQVHILMHNGFQILRILTAAFGDDLFTTRAVPASPMCTSPASDLEELACAWQTIVRTAPRTAPRSHATDPDPFASPAYDAWVAATLKWLRTAQQIMSGMASNYDTPKLGLGLGAAACSLVLSLAAALYAFKGEGTSTTSTLSAAAIAPFAPFALINITYGIMMFASSYVEEEHHFWYWATSGWIAHVGLRSIASTSASTSKKSVSATVAALAAVRLLRAWNQTGQKFAGAPDLAKTFLQPNPALLWTLVMAVYVVTGYQIIRGFLALAHAHAHAHGGRRPSLFVVGLTIPTVVLFVWSAFSFKLIFTYQDSPELVGSFARPLVDGILELTKIGARAAAGGHGGATLVARARLVFFGLGLATAAAVYLIVANPYPAAKTAKTATTPPKTQILLPIYTLLAVTQSRTTNIPIFLLFSIVYRFLAISVAQLSLADLTTAMLLLEYASFFAFGGTNAVSSVDLSSAYNGIAVFSPASVGVLTFLSNWAGPIYWAVAASILLHQQQLHPKIETRRIWLQHANLLTVFAAASAVAVMAACTALRTHLFVWTVFSPKYLYCVAWNLGMHLAVNLGLGSLLYWLGTF